MDGTDLLTGICIVVFVVPIAIACLVFLWLPATILVIIGCIFFAVIHKIESPEPTQRADDYGLVVYPSRFDD